MQIRSFQLSDYSQITGLLQEVLSEESYIQTMEAFGRQISWDSDLVLVAEDNNCKIVGIIIGTIDNNKGYYYRVAVSELCQRQGIGKELVNALKQRFIHRKVSKILITDDGHNKPAFPLFESLGFVSSDFISSFQKLRIVNG